MQPAIDNNAAVGLLALVLAGFGLYTRLTIKSMLGDFKDTLIEKLNGTYLRTELANSRFEAVHRRLEALEERNHAH